MSELINELLIESSFNIKKVGNKKYYSNGISKESFTNNTDKYELINCKNLLLTDVIIKEQLIKVISKTIKQLLNYEILNNVLIIGLGNRHIKADSLGTEVLKNVISTRNIIKSKTQVSAFSTSVLGLTGIESADLIKGVAKVIKPNLIILIDTLCANDYKKLGVNFQISTNIFKPGAGIGNNRKNIELKGIKTISIGVPLVVYAKNLIGNKYKSKNDDSFNNLIVTMKDVDKYVSICGKIIGFSLNKVFNNFSIDEQKTILQLI